MATLLVLVVLLGLEAWAVTQVLKRTPRARLRSVPSLSAVGIQAPPPVDEIRARISQEPWTRGGDALERSLGALRWTMNAVSGVEPSRLTDPGAILRAVDAGRGLLCGGMATLYRSVLATVDVPNRLITLSRNIFDETDTHVTVEALVDGRWVLLDPTFHISFRTPGGAFLSAQDVKAHLFGGRRDEVRVTFLGEVAYPARYDKYYMDLLACFNNVFVAEDGSRHRLLRLPPLVYWFGGTRYYERLPQESVSHLKFMNQYYFVSVVLLPALILIAALAALGMR